MGDSMPPDPLSSCVALSAPLPKDLKLTVSLGEVVIPSFKKKKINLKMEAIDCRGGFRLFQD